MALFANENLNSFTTFHCLLTLFFAFFMMQQSLMCDKFIYCQSSVWKFLPLDTLEVYIAFLRRRERGAGGRRGEGEGWGRRGLLVRTGGGREAISAHQHLKYRCYREYREPIYLSIYLSMNQGCYSILYHKVISSILKQYSFYLWKCFH